MLFSTVHYQLTIISMAPPAMTSLDLTSLAPM
uniref:Uncharacterized protein n=1 Tax=Anguilla anguilla TaxID=7936 RepID=A0A0E9W1K3_ANGAN